MKKVFIIAEAGVNHNGDIRIAKKMIDVASGAGADAVKFQTFKADMLACKNAPKAEYQTKTTERSESQLDMLKKLELSPQDHHELINYAKKKGIMFLSTAFDVESVNLLKSFGLKIFKIPSGEITNLPYLRKVGALDVKIILSTGMADIGEIEDALDVLIEAGAKKEEITVLHANTEYPTPFVDVNLNAMLTIRDAFGVKVGYSDHTTGIEVSIAAVALGAEVIEKHFTLDRGMPGPDHKASLQPDELATMIKAIRNIKLAMGNGLKKPSRSEKKNMVIARKSIVAARKIKKGERLTEKNLAVKRPGSGISPMMWDSVIGRSAARNFAEDEEIEI